MTDPFLAKDRLGLLEEEMQRLRLENRKLRQENTNLTQRLKLITPATSVDEDGPATSELGPSGSARHLDSSEADAPTQHGTVGHSSGANAVETSAPSPALSSSQQQQQQHQQHSSPPPRRTRSAAAAGSEVSAARLREAVQQVKKELQGELDAHRKAAGIEKAEKEQLKREFELFVSMTCEREAAYQLVYTQLYRELEEQKELVRTAQGQVERQREDAVEMRRAMETAIKAAAAASAAARRGGDASGAVAASTLSAPHLARPAEGATGTSEGEDQASVSAHHTGAPAGGSAGKRVRATEAPPPPSSPTARRRVDAQLQSGTAAPASEADTATETNSNASTPTEGEAVLKLVANGAQLRKVKRGRGRAAQSPTTTTTALSSTAAGAASPPPLRATRGLPRELPTRLHVPTAPVFDSPPAPPAAATSAITAGPDSASAPFKGSSLSSSAATSTGTRLEVLWQRLVQHTEATEGFLPLWEALSSLRGPDQHTALRVLTSVLVHLLGPDAAHGFSPLPTSFTTQPSSLTVVATAIRLLAVQVAQNAQMGRSHADTPQQRSITVLLSSLFYRMCVATLRRWQVADGAADALEHWATVMHHLYGFQPALLQLMKFTNTTAAYQRTRLPHSWITYAAQAIFAQCCTAGAALSSPASASSSLPSSEAEAATVRWREVCDGVGWSPHALPLEQVEAAAARCVATTRVGRGPLTAACAEEALLALRLVVLYKGFDHMEHVAKLLEQPGVLPMAITKEIYAELVSFAVRDGVPFRTQDALHHALRLLREYLQEVGPERCTSAEHFVCAPRRSHVLAALALLRAAESTAPSVEGSSAAAGAPAGRGVTAAAGVQQEGRRAALQWLEAQKVALEMVHQSPALSNVRFLLLRDSPLGHILMREVSI